MAITLAAGLTAVSVQRAAVAEKLSERLKGRILLAVEDKGQAWYVDPVIGQRTFLGRPADALRIMREFGLGVAEKDYHAFAGRAPARLAGRILLRVEAAGEAYYVEPAGRRLYYFGRPDDAFRLMREFGLGITNRDLSEIPIRAGYAEEKIAGDNPAQGDENEYPLHENITATVFWVGEPVGNGSSEDNAFSSWDDDWLASYGGYDDPFCREGYFPCGFTPQENPFYVSVPFNDFHDNGTRKQIAYAVVPWAGAKEWRARESMMKNRWVKISREDITCYGQVQDTGPYEYNDYEYVFNNARPLNQRANGAGMDVSPALRDCLGFQGENNAENKIDWRFVDETIIPKGPWKESLTTSQVNWR